ncbi:MAG: hypothetical protein U0835_01795 [Isosphaeraceae bacterium]
MASTTETKLASPRPRASATTHRMSRAVSTRRRRRLSVDGLGIVNGRSVVVDQFRSSHAQHTGRSQGRPEEDQQDHVGLIRHARDP